MYIKLITYCGQLMAVGCDGKCNKAWGINCRPKNQLSDNEDDYEYLSDDELGNAPDNPGTYEGGQGKPQNEDEKLNKWCVRECERCVSRDSAWNKLQKFPDFSKRIKNIKDD